MKKKKKSFPKKSALLLTASALLLIGSTVGSTRAALTYYSENYSAQIEMQNIGVSLLENGDVVSSQDFTSKNQQEVKDGELLTGLLGEKEKFAPGKKYKEELSVQNSGNIDTFVRVILTKSWQDKEGKKNTTLSPDLIELNFLTANGWVVADQQTTDERTVLYYTKAVKAGDTTPALSDTLRIDPKIATEVEKTVKDKTITYTYKYNGYTFHIDAEVDAVQTHNAKDAIKSAWGVDVNVSDDETTMVQSMKKKILCLAMTVIMAAGVHTTAFAKDYQGADGWQVHFTGDKMESNFENKTVSDELATIQPGDSIELKVQLKNSDKGETDWYMTNEIIQTLEEAQESAEGGAYEYKLTYVGSDNTEKVLYNSDTVGGEGSSKTGEGLKELGNSTEKYFYLGRLASNGTGTVHLTIGIEGETQGNGYQNTLAKLRMNFAVEKVKVSNTITKTKIVKTTNTVKTGDTARVLLFCVLALISGLILLAYGIYTYNKNTKKRRRKGE